MKISWVVEHKNTKDFPKITSVLKGSGDNITFWESTHNFSEQPYYFSNQYEKCVCETVCQASWTMAKWSYPELAECALFMVKHLKSDNWFSHNVSGICKGIF